MLAEEQGDSGYYNWQDLTYKGEEVNGFTVIDTIDGDDRRWSKGVQVILQGPSEAFYSFEYDQPLTENSGEREFYSNSVKEVARKVEQVYVVTWVDPESLTTED